MTKNEREAIEAACKALDMAFDIDTFTYDRGNVMRAHGILKAIELSPSKPTAKAKAQPEHTAKVEKTENEKTAKAQTPSPA